MLADEQVEAFVRDGFVKLEESVPRAVADEARELLWKRIGLPPGDPSRWTEPVVWTSDLDAQGPFLHFARSERLNAALDAVAGVGGWRPRGALGNIPVRFPHLPAADDCGWHIDLNTMLPDGQWTVSREPQTMLILTLLSEVGIDDAPTRIRVGSQRDTWAALGPAPMSHLDAGPLLDAASAARPVAYATGRPGDVYLCHPLTVHAAQPHRGDVPRFMAQTPVFLSAPLTPGGPSPLARALRDT
ncbi:hypothetical protein SAMN05421505_1288 [Sinosporangium album]|uniref:Phytanoyl-CoA dioxygenase (PhyH) n=1 Tax=Sinosporangium album TaxID=504805 RepID=A0A1G8GLZ7_9ACTN|nr:hypothetical protein SAMN05421505_1288 [Sinosporangium album]